jgi:hypothetical protein
MWSLDIQAGLPFGHWTYKLISHVVTGHTSQAPMWSLDIQAGCPCGHSLLSLDIQVHLLHDQGEYTILSPGGAM